MNFWDSDNWKGLTREQFDKKVPKSARLAIEECENICSLFGLEFYHFAVGDNDACEAWLKKVHSKSSYFTLSSVFEMAHSEKVVGGFVGENLLWCRSWFGRYVDTARFLAPLGDLVMQRLGAPGPAITPEVLGHFVQDDPNYPYYATHNVGAIIVWDCLCNTGMVRKEAKKALVEWAKQSADFNFCNWPLVTIVEKVLDRTLALSARELADLGLVFPKDYTMLSGYFLSLVVHKGVLEQTGVDLAPLVAYQEEEADYEQRGLRALALAGAEILGVHLGDQDEDEDWDEDEDLDDEDWGDEDPLALSEDERQELYDGLLESFLESTSQSAGFSSEPEEMVATALSSGSYEAVESMRQINYLERFSRESFKSLPEAQWEIASILRGFYLQSMGLTLNLHGFPLGEDAPACVPFVVIVRLTAPKGVTLPDKGELLLDNPLFPETPDDENFFGDLDDINLSVCWDSEIYSLDDLLHIDLDHLGEAQIRALEEGCFDISESALQERARQDSFKSMSPLGEGELSARGLFALCGMITGPCDELQEKINASAPSGVRVTPDEPGYLLLDKAGKNPTAELIETEICDFLEDQGVFDTEARVFSVIPLVHAGNKSLVEGLGSLASLFSVFPNIFDNLPEEISPWVDLSDPRSVREQFAQFEGTPAEQAFSHLLENGDKYDYYTINGMEFPLPFGVPVPRPLRSTQIVRRSEKMIRAILESYGIRVEGRMKALV